MSGGDVPDRIGTIDSLRCFAMMAVTCQHAGLLPCGWVGVWLFYVISGFVVTASLDSHGGAGAPLLKSFYLRRAARILPLYFLFVLIGTVGSVWSSGVVDWRTFFSLLLFYNNFDIALDRHLDQIWTTGHFWTLSVEMQFYLFYGLAFAFLSRRNLVHLLAVTLIVCPLLRLALGEILSGSGQSDETVAYTIYMFSVSHFDSFALGALLGLLHAAGQLKMRARTFFWAGLAAFTAYVAVFAAVNALVLDRRGLDIIRNIISGILFGEGRQIFVYPAIALLAGGMIAATVGGVTFWQPVVRNRWAQAIGKISYGAYVYHLVGLVVSGWLLTYGLGIRDMDLASRLLMFVCAISITLALAYASYRYFERPIIDSLAAWLDARSWPRPALVT
jgi:peptidoglycan/LPS O-acetylase OafA/YrhL